MRVMEVALVVPAGTAAAGVNIFGATWVKTFFNVTIGNGSNSIFKEQPGLMSLLTTTFPNCKLREV